MVTLPQLAKWSGLKESQIRRLRAEKAFKVRKVPQPTVWGQTMFVLDDDEAQRFIQSLKPKPIQVCEEWLSRSIRRN